LVRPAAAGAPVALKEVPVPRPLQRILEKVIAADRHPGLQLDKLLLPCPKQEQQREALGAVTAIPGHPDLLAELRGRREACLEALGARRWSRVTEGPLTLHLARASALENAGLCLHPVYGFAYLPGTGLKGMARAYAETVWLAGLPEDGRPAGWARVEEVFGWAPGSDMLAPDVPKPWKPAGGGHAEDDAAAAGAVVFHDAWPETWPKLTVDIVNNHHSRYYQEGQPPGDWEGPVPVYFLAVPAGQSFTFALGKRRAAVSDELLCLAAGWLDGALTHLGCGAKTAAGYGSFQAAAGLTADPPPARGGFRARLELVTPAFLAGGRQQAEDCELRPATLRGLLRWWWRTAHAGFLSVPELRALEATLWGDTHAGGAVRLTVRPASAGRPRLYNYKDRFEPRADFKRRHRLADRPNNKTTQGLFYASYGMDEVSRGEARRRYFAEPGSPWEVLFTARDCRHFAQREEAARPQDRARGRVLRREQVLAEAETALWLLCTFGGVGSKARKGFGSLQEVSGRLAGWDLERCREAAASLRRALGLDHPFDPARAESPALAQALVAEEVSTPWADPWQVLDQVGFVYQAFTQDHAHDPAKAALGLPRRIHGPRDEGPMQTRDGRVLQDPAAWRPPAWLDLPAGFPYRSPHAQGGEARHASPVHIHLARGAQGDLAVRVLAFPARYLPDGESSARLLRELLEHWREEWGRRVAAGTRPPGPRDGRAPETRPAAASGKRDHGTPATVTILAERKGGFDVQEAGKPNGVLNQGKAPAELPAVGARVNVYVYNDDPRCPQYRWDAPPPPRPGPGRGGRGPQGRGRR
jgi:CRISPR-associated protein Cmr6